MLSRLPVVLLSCLAYAALSASAAHARDQIRIAGSATVYPFSASVAEHFGKLGDFRTPIVEATGTGAGFKLFCAGIGESYPDVSNASRTILPSESESCTKKNIQAPVEAKFGYDGITLANSTAAPRFRLTKRQIFLALARDIPKDGKLTANPYTRWRQIDASLPDLPIKVYGTPPVSGTRDTFVELVMEKGCSELPDFAQLFTDEKARKKQCKFIREDGAFIEAGENGNLIAQKLIGDPESLGIFGFSFLDQNLGRVQGSFIDGVEPTFESIQNGSYGISRALYFYVKTEHLKLAPGLADFVHEFTSEAAIGDEGYLVMQGLVPLPESERTKIRRMTEAALGK